MSKFARGWIRPRFARWRILTTTFLSVFFLPGRFFVREPELAPKDLGAKECEDAEKEKEENEKGHNRFDRVDQRPKQVLKGSPVPGTRVRLFNGGYTNS